VFRLANVSGRAALCDGDAYHDLEALADDASFADPMTAIARAGELHALAERANGREPTGSLASARLGPCVPRPEKVFGIGLNYRSHAGESGVPLPPAPLTFTKFPSCLVGPFDDVELRGESVDWEVELVAVVGRGGRDIREADAWAHVAGLTLGQDLSDRTVQFAGASPQFCLGKSFDTYGPIGPALVSVDAFDDPDDVAIWCDVSGERMQDARTSDLIFSVAYLVSYLSSICTLAPGDVIFTGTPAGVGMARGRYLRDGDVVESGADVIGCLRNRCVAGAR
jgi:2-keto-4-pentenoate hydratase/2-oxohepta-3-ene-1,7-dioic acid hydratase in catechol pathway